MIGKTFGAYRIDSILGSGGMGQVYVATDLELKRKVALKVLHSDMATNRDSLSRFKLEVRSIAALNHPNIVTIYSVDQHENTVFFVMEMVDGSMLKELIPANGMNASSFFKFSIPLCDALVAAHSKGILHRDLKPANIMVGKDGRLKIIDFGLAKLVHQGAEDVDLSIDPETTLESSRGKVIGTLPYMSPEQVKGKTLDARSDLWSLGAIFYEMTTGFRAFTADSNAELISSILRDRPDPADRINKDLPVELVPLINRCLEKDPQKRFQTASEILAILTNLENSRLTTSHSRYAKPHSSTGLAAVVFTDVVGYSSLSYQSEKKALGFLNELYGIMDSVFEKHSGRIIKKIGDGTLISFTSGLTAVQFALDLQKRMAERNRQIDEGNRFWLRAGIHIGDVVFEEDEVLGDGVKLASMIESKCPKGSVCITAPIFDMVETRVHERFVSLGKVKLVNMERPMELFYADLPWIEDRPRKTEAVGSKEPERGRPLRDAVLGGVFLILGCLAVYSLIQFKNRNTANPLEPGPASAVIHPMDEAQHPNLNMAWQHPRPLMVSGTARAEKDCVFGPDSRTFAYVAELEIEEEGRTRTVNKVFVGNLDPSQPHRQVTTGPFDDRHPSWHPDGKRIFYSRSTSELNINKSDAIYGIFGDNAEVFKVDLETGKETNLSTSSGIGEAGFPVVSPDGKFIAFSKSIASAEQCFIADVNGNQMEQITRPAANSANFEPSWSPDSKKIALRKFPYNKIHIVDIQTRREVELETGRGAAMFPHWSPDGKYIYYTAYIATGLNLWRVPVDFDGTATGAAEPVTFGPGHDYWARVSPDGKHLTYYILQMNSDIYRLKIDPGTGRPVAGFNGEEMVTSRVEDSRAVFSKDMKFLAFNSDRSGTMNLWVRDMASGSEWPLTTGPVGYGLSGDYQASWAPDNSAIAFFSHRSGNLDIWIIDVKDGKPAGEPRNLTRDPSMDINPFFSPDGQWIAFVSDRNGVSQLFVIKPDGSQVQKLMDQRAGGHFIPWYGNEVSHGSFADDLRGVAVVSLSNQVQRLIFKLSAEGKAKGKWMGGHHSFGPDGNLMMECTGHKSFEVWNKDQEYQTIYNSNEHEFVDYPVWSPDGNWLTFDRAVLTYGGIYHSERVETN